MPQHVWEQALAAETESRNAAAADPPAAVLSLVEEREAARARQDWAASDDLRERIAAAGWEVRDTSSGPELAPL